MVSALDSGSGGPGSSPDRGTALCSWAKHFTLIVPLSTQVYKWVPANLLLGVTLRWTSIPSRGGRNTPSRFMLRKPGISTGLMGHLARMQTLPLPYLAFKGNECVIYLYCLMTMGL